MRILFANESPFLPQLVGGIEISTLDLAHALQERGQDPAVMSSLVSRNALWLRNRIMGKLLRQGFPMDRYRGLRVYRGWNVPMGLAEVAARERADVIVAQGGSRNAYEIAAHGRRLGCRTFFYTHDLGVILRREPLPDLEGVTWVANSAFTARTLFSHLNVSCAIVPPLFRPEAYRTGTPAAAGNKVTLINPRPEKGGALAVHMAELCPDIPFLFVEAWASAIPEVQTLKARAARLKNVTWLPAQQDMRTVYGATRVLLMPSQCQETWGRVITEAQFLGIPALTSHLGALPETLGPGGIAVEADAPTQQWVEALRSLYSKDAIHAHYAGAALAYGQREEISRDRIVSIFLNVLQEH